MKAIVLCAGYGTRLGALTRDRPKPLLEVGGAPLLAWTLTWLAAHGFDEVAVNTHHQPDAIPAAIGDGSDHGVRLTVAYEPVLLGTAGTVRALASWIGDEDVLVVYGDVLCDHDLSTLVAARARGDGALLLHRRPNANSFVEMDEQGQVRRFVERPSDEERSALPDGWVNSGVQILSPRAVAMIPERVPADLPRDLYVPSVGALRLVGVPLTGFRVAIDSADRYTLARAAVDDGRYSGPRPVAVPRYGVPPGGVA